MAELIAETLPHWLVSSIEPVVLSIGEMREEKPDGSQMRHAALYLGKFHTRRIERHRVRALAKRCMALTIRLEPAKGAGLTQGKRYMQQKRCVAFESHVTLQYRMDTLRSQSQSGLRKLTFLKSLLSADPAEFYQGAKEEFTRVTMDLSLTQADRRVENERENSCNR